MDRTYRIHRKSDKYINGTVTKSERKRPFSRSLNWSTRKTCVLVDCRHLTQDRAKSWVLVSEIAIKGPEFFVLHDPFLDIRGQFSSIACRQHSFKFGTRLWLPHCARRCGRDECMNADGHLMLMNRILWEETDGVVITAEQYCWPFSTKGFIQYVLWAKKLYETRQCSKQN